MMGRRRRRAGMKKRILTAVCGIFSGILLSCEIAGASVDTSWQERTGNNGSGREEWGTDDLIQDLLSELSLEEIDDVLRQDHAAGDLSFSELLRRVIRTQDADITQTEKRDFLRAMFSLLFADIKEYKYVFIRLLILTIAFSFLNHFMSVFTDSGISKTGFYMFFMILMTFLMKSYQMLNSTLLETAGQITGFMQVLLPAFCTTMVFSSANLTAASFYQIVLTVIWLVERVLLYMVAPGIHIYAVLQMLNHMTGGRLISRWTVLLKRIIVWTLRALLAGVTGMNLVENIIAPSADNLQKLSVTKTIGMIPGLGGAAEAVGSILIGSAAVIKNGVGVSAMIVLMIICAGPMIKLLVFTLFYRAASAIVQPFANARVCGCIDSAGDAAGLLLRTMITAVSLFLISIAVVLTAMK